MTVIIGLVLALIGVAAGHRVEAEIDEVRA